MMQRVRWVCLSARTHTHTHTHTHTQAHTHRHTHTGTHTRRHTHTQAHTVMADLKALLFLSLTYKHLNSQGVSV